MDPRIHPPKSNIRILVHSIHSFNVSLASSQDSQVASKMLDLNDIKFFKLLKFMDECNTSNIELIRYEILEDMFGKDSRVDSTIAKYSKKFLQHMPSVSLTMSCQNCGDTVETWCDTVPLDIIRYEEKGIKYLENCLANEYPPKNA